MMYFGAMSLSCTRMFKWWDGGGSEGQKSKKKPPKLQVWEKDSLIMKEKVSEHCDVNAPPGDWCPASLWATNTSEETWPSVSLLSMTLYSMESLWYFRSAVPAVSSPSLLCTPHWGGRGRGASQKKQRQCCAPKASTIGAAVKEITSLPAKLYNFCFLIQVICIILRWNIR